MLRHICPDVYRFAFPILMLLRGLLLKLVRVLQKILHFSNEVEGGEALKLASGLKR